MSIVRLLTILAIGAGLTIASVLVWILASIVHRPLRRQGVTPLVPGYDGIAVLVILMSLLTIRASIHGPGTVWIHRTRLTKANWLRLTPCPPRRVRLLRRHLGMVG